MNNKFTFNAPSFYLCSGWSSGTVADSVQRVSEREGGVGVMERWSIVEDPVSDGGRRDIRKLYSKLEIREKNVSSKITIPKILFIVFTKLLYSNTPILRKKDRYIIPPLSGVTQSRTLRTRILFYRSYHG